MEGPGSPRRANPLAYHEFICLQQLLFQSRHDQHAEVRGTHPNSPFCSAKPWSWKVPEKHRVLSHPVPWRRCWIWTSSAATWDKQLLNNWHRPSLQACSTCSSGVLAFRIFRKGGPCKKPGVGRAQIGQKWSKCWSTDIIRYPQDAEGLHQIIGPQAATHGRSFASQVDPISRGRWWIAAPGGETAIKFEESVVGCRILCPGTNDSQNVSWDLKIR